MKENTYGKTAKSWKNQETGRKKHIGFVLDQLDLYVETVYTPEKSAWAGVEFWVKKKNLFSHSEDSENLDKVNIPLGHFSDWIVQAWPLIKRKSYFPGTSMKKEWRRITDEDVDKGDAFYNRHFILSGANGCILPCLTFHREDDWLVIQKFPTDDKRWKTDSSRDKVKFFYAESVFEELVKWTAKRFKERRIYDAYPWACPYLKLNDFYKPGRKRERPYSSC